MGDGGTHWGGVVKWGWKLHVVYIVPVTHRQVVIKVSNSIYAYFIIARAFIETSATFIYFTGAHTGHL